MRLGESPPPHLWSFYGWLLGMGHYQKLSVTVDAIIIIME
jgi:hypothetical protein